MTAGVAAAVAVLGAAGALAPARHRGRSLPSRPGRSQPPRRVGAVRLDPTSSAVRTTGSVVLLAVCVVALGPFPAIVGAVGAWTSGRARTVVHTRRARAAVGAAVPDGLELLVLLLHAGLTPSIAARELARHAPEPLRPGWHAVVLRLERGRSVADAVTALVDHHGPAVAPAVNGLVAAERYGTPLAPALERWTDEIRASRRRSAEAEARALSVRMSFPLVCCTLPSFVLLAIVPTLAGTVSTLRGIG